MNLQKLLAENMIRFGTKNLTSAQKKKLLKEQLEPLNLSALTVSQEEREYCSDGDEQEFYQYIFQFLKDNGIIFSIPQSEAAYIITYNAEWYGFGTNDTKRWKRDGKFKKDLDLKLMDSPIDTEKVLTRGNIFSDRIENPQDLNGESEYLDIIKFCNNYSLMRYKEGGRGGAKLGTNSDSGRAEVTELSTRRCSLYGTLSTTSAQSNQVVNTTVFTIPAVGKSIEKLFPGSIFATGQITLADSTELDKAIAELTTLSQDKTIKITGIIIQSGASGDRAVDNKSGYPKESDVAAKTYTIENPYRPKSPTESGNAKLAFGRAQTIKSKLGNLAPITIDYMIANGGDAAQYAKIIANIEKTDGPGTPVTKKDLQNILLKPKAVENLQSTKTVAVFVRFVVPGG